jgi:hypothetical protein
VATAGDMIKRAMRLSGNLGVGESLDASEGEDGLTALNAMLDSWANDKLFVHVLTLDDITLIPNTAAYTVGPTGGTVTARPVNIDSATYALIDGISYPLAILTTAEYGQITLKTTTSPIPEGVWYNPTYPDATITIYPVPSATGTLKLWSVKQMQSFASLTATLTLPPGYEDAIVFSLAEVFGLEFLTEPSPTLMRKASAARSRIRRTNFVSECLQMPPYVLPGVGRFNIYSGLIQ